MTTSPSSVLYPYQAEIIPRLLGHRRQGLFDDPGSGKTLMVLAALEQDGLFERPSNILILATKTGAALTWQRHIDEYVPKNVIINQAYNGPVASRRGIVSGKNFTQLTIGNHALVQESTLKISAWDRLGTPALFGVKWDAIIVDESHRVLPTTAEWKSQYTNFWNGMMQLQKADNPLLIAMSGTPDRGKLFHRYGTMKFLLPERYNDRVLPYWEWAEQNFNISYQNIRIPGGKTIEKKTPTTLRDPENWNGLEHLLTIRRTKAEIAPQLPGKRYIDIVQPMPTLQQAGYDSLTADENDPEGSYVRFNQFATVPHVIEMNPVTGKKVAIAHRGASSWKRDWIIDWLESRETGSVVITAEYTGLLHWMSEELIDAGFKQPLMLHGGMTTAARLQSQMDFQSGQNRIMLLNTSIGDSIDLDFADDMIFLVEPADPDKATQTEDRIHRVSRDHTTFFWRLRSANSIDTIRAQTNQARYDTTRKVYDGSRGIDFQRQIVATIRKGKNA